jgi:osmotically-inducible protein OsmY
MRRACRPAALLLLVFLAACGAATSGTHDDATISTRVKIALLNEPGLGERRLDARTFQGIVTLTGTVHSQAEADRALEAARRVRGVRGVKSEIKIESGTGHQD